LQVAATVNAQLVNAASVGSDAQVSRQTVQNYFQVLKDTLLGFDLEPYTETVKRKAIGTPKFYFFDMGVVRALRRMKPITSANTEFGEFFEHFIFLELRAWIDLTHPRMPLHYWRSRSGFEVDFIVDESIAIEAKATNHATEKHLRGLKALAEERSMKRLVLVCREKAPRRIDDIEILPWDMFLDELWSGSV
jgi:predicted AAA+ superfamily ATPase